MADGRLFVVDGDLTALVCDAVLVPTGPSLGVDPSWHELLDGSLSGGHLDGGRLDGPLDADRRVARVEGTAAPAVWAGLVDDEPADPAWYADLALRYVGAAASHARRAGSSRPGPPRVAVGVPGSGAAGFAERKGALLRTLVPGLAQAAEREGADVVLVCRGRRPYAAAQRARRHLRRHHDLGDLEDVVDRLAERAGARSLVLFMGAGVSAGAGVPDWPEMLGSMAADAPGSPIDLAQLAELDARDQAAIIRKRFGDDDAYRECLVAQMAQQTRCSLLHGLLASLDTDEAVTTNYDLLYERAKRTAGRDVAVLPGTVVEPGRPWLLKLHGSLDDPSTMVLTRDDFRSLPATAGALFGLLQAMLLTRHVLFVGYSLRDEDFHEVASQVRSATSGAERKVGTALVLTADPLQQELWSDLIDVVPVARHGEAPAEAARRVEILLDEVALRSNDAGAFLLDPAYADLLEPAERDLADALRAVERHAAAVSSPTADRLRTLLAQLGADPPPR